MSFSRQCPRSRSELPAQRNSVRWRTCASRPTSRSWHGDHHVRGHAARRRRRRRCRGGLLVAVDGGRAARDGDLRAGRGRLEARSRSRARRSSACSPSIPPRAGRGVGTALMRRVLDDSRRGRTRASSARACRRCAAPTASTSASGFERVPGARLVAGRRVSSCSRSRSGSDATNLPGSWDGRVSQRPSPSSSVAA